MIATGTKLDEIPSLTLWLKTNACLVLDGRWSWVELQGLASIELGRRVANEEFFEAMSDAGLFGDKA